MPTENVLTVSVSGSGENAKTELTIASADGSVVQLDAFECAPERRESKERFQLRICNIALKAALVAQEHRLIDKIVFYTHSTFVLQNYKKAMFEWPNTGWKDRYSRKKIDNSDIWKQLLRQLRRLDQKRVRINWALDSEPQSPLEENSASRFDAER